jgi:putative phosphoribosyl transferase
MTMTHSARFADRVAAGRQLVDKLERFTSETPVILGLSRGGLPVAAQVAHALRAPLDVLVVRKIGAPSQPELGVGALAEGGVQVIDTVLCERLGIGDAEVRRLVRGNAAALDATVEAYRADHPRHDLSGRLAIVVDDGLATGSTAHAAIRSARRAGATSVVLAVPVASQAGIRRLQQVADEVVWLSAPEDFASVGQHYDAFDQVSDAEALGSLASESPTDVVITTSDAKLPGILAVPHGARLLVVFAHGSGSSRLSPRNQEVAQTLQQAGVATLLLDLLTEEESLDRDNVFDIEHLADRLEGAIAWSRTDPRTDHLGVGLFGASTGAAAAIAVAARCPDLVKSIVSRGGRPDLAGAWLPRVEAPTLLIVGGADVDVLRLNRLALSRLRCPATLEIVPGAGHLFEEPGALHRAAVLARDWFTRTSASRAA